MINTSLRKFYVFLCGFEILPKEVSLRGAGSRIFLCEPICSYLAVTEKELILFDTGLDASRLNDPALLKHFFTDRGWTVAPIVRPEHSLLTQLAEIGVKPSDVSRVVISHTHADHTGYLKFFTHADIHIQKSEYEDAFTSPDRLGWIKEDYDLPGLRWQPHEGDLELAPGLRLLSTPGHTVGHQSAFVRLPSGKGLVLTFDAGDLRENFDKEILPGASCNDEAALNSIRRLKNLAGEKNNELFLFHDPEFLKTVKLSPEYYD